MVEKTHQDVLDEIALYKKTLEHDELDRRNLGRIDSLKIELYNYVGCFAVVCHTLLVLIIIYMTTADSTSNDQVSIEAVEAGSHSNLAQELSAAEAFDRDRAWNRAQNGSTCQTVILYFGSTSGLFRKFPGRDQDGPSFDGRQRPWYRSSISVRHELQVLLDRGNEMGTQVIQDAGATYLDVAKNLALELLQTVSPGDDVQVFSFDNATAISSAFRVISILSPFGHSELAGSLESFIFQDENSDSDPSRPWYVESCHEVLPYMSETYDIQMRVGLLGESCDSPRDVKFQKFASHGALYGSRIFQLDNQSATHGSTLERIAASSGMPTGSSHQENWITRLVHHFSIQLIAVFFSSCVSFLIILYLKRGSSSYHLSARMDSSIKATHSTAVQEDDATSPNNDLMESLLRDQMKIALEPLVGNVTAALLQRGREQRKQRQMMIAMEEQKLALQKEKVQWLKHAPTPEQLELKTLLNQQELCFSALPEELSALWFPDSNANEKSVPSELTAENQLGSQQPYLGGTPEFVVAPGLVFDSTRLRKALSLLCWDSWRAHTAQELCNRHLIDRNPKCSEDLWGTMLKSFNPIRQHQSSQGATGWVNYWDMDADAKYKNKLPQSFPEKSYTAMERIIANKCQLKGERQQKRPVIWITTLWSKPYVERFVNASHYHQADPIAECGFGQHIGEGSGMRDTPWILDDGEGQTTTRLAPFVNHQVEDAVQSALDDHIRPSYEESIPGATYEKDVLVASLTSHLTQLVQSPVNNAIEDYVSDKVPIDKDALFQLMKPLIAEEVRSAIEPISSLLAQMRAERMFEQEMRALEKKKRALAREEEVLFKRQRVANRRPAGVARKRQGSAILPTLQGLNITSAEDLSRDHLSHEAESELVNMLV